MTKRWTTAAVIAMLTAAADAGVRIDLNADNGRNDGNSLLAENWRFKNSAESLQAFGGMQLKLATPDGQLEGVFNKAGYNTGAILGSDGVVAKSGNITLSLSGLSPGKHSVATFHNAVDKEPAPRVKVAANRGELVAVVASIRAAHDDDVAAAYVTFDADTTGAATIHIAAESGPVILNGIEIDLPDPNRRVSMTMPPAGEEHADPETKLSWRAPASGATSYRVFLGDDAAVVAAAEPEKNRTFAVETTETTFKPAKPLDHTKSYFWRVDAVAKSGEVTRGLVSQLRARHDAFPGAEGYGRYARGGRGGKVIEVTSLEDSGPGTLREAINTDGPRTIVFRVGGTIHLKDKLIINKPYCTIAGQTAPGEGIATRGYTFATGGTRDVIVRYMRIRIGDESGVTMDGSGVGGCDHCIVDHCSIAWSIDEGFSSRGAKNITLQRSIITEPLNMSIHSHYVGTGKGHSFAGSISGNVGSFHHNLLANCAGRNWSLAGGLTSANTFAGYLDIRNNVVYNWQHRTNDGGVRALNLVNNAYIPGPASKVFHLLIAKMELKLPNDIQQYYVSGNTMEGREQYDADNWKNGGVEFEQEWLDRMKLAKPFCEPLVESQSAAETYKTVVADVGPNIPMLDSIDRRALENTLKRTTTFKGSKTGTPGIIDSQKDVGEYADLKSGEAPADNDHDGMADWWEKEHGLDPANADDRNKVGEDGYTELEHYLHWIVENGGLTKKTK